MGGRGFPRGGGKEVSGTFLEKEINDALDEMKSSSAPGPDGLPASFSKLFGIR
jgi:hypothetical protein